MFTDVLPGAKTVRGQENSIIGNLTCSLGRVVAISSNDAGPYSLGAVLDAIKQRRHCYAKGFGNLRQVIEANVLLAAFNLADGGTHAIVGS